MVTGMSEGKIGLVIDRLDGIRLKLLRLRAVLSPGRPWVRAADLQTGTRMLIDNRRKVRVFEKMGVRAFPNVKGLSPGYVENYT